MELRRHRNGTFSLTNLTRADMENLAFAACTAESFMATNPSVAPASDYAKRRTATFGRLYRKIKRVTETGSSVTIKVWSDRLDSSDLVYAEVVPGLAEVLPAPEVEVR